MFFFKGIISHFNNLSLCKIWIPCTIVVHFHYNAHFWESNLLLSMYRCQLAPPPNSPPWFLALLSNLIIFLRTNLIVRTPNRHRTKIKTGIRFFGLVFLLLAPQRRCVHGFRVSESSSPVQASIEWSCWCCMCIMCNLQQTHDMSRIHCGHPVRKMQCWLDVVCCIGFNDLLWPFESLQTYLLISVHASCWLFRRDCGTSRQLAVQDGAVFLLREQ